MNSDTIKSYTQVALMLGSRFAGRGTQIVSFLLIARGLSADKFGVYGLLTSAVMLAVQLGNLGLRQASAVMIGNGHYNEREVIPTLLVAWPVLAAGSVGAVLYFSDRGTGNAPPAIIWPLTVSIFAGLLIIMLQGVFLGRNDIKDFGISDLLPRALLSIAAVLLFLLGEITIVSAMWAFAASFSLALPYVLWRAIAGLHLRRARIKSLVIMMRYGIVFAISMFLISLNGRVGLFILDQHADVTDVGHFLAAQRLNEVFLEIATAVSLVMFSRLASKPKNGGGIELAIESIPWLFWSYFIVTAVTYFATPTVITLLLGSSYIGSIGLLQIIVWGLPAAAVVKVMNGAIAGAGLPKLSAAVVGIVVLTNLLITLLLAPAMGAPAAAFGLVGSQVMGMLCYAFVAKWKFHISLTALVLPRRKRRI